MNEALDNLVTLFNDDTFMYKFIVASFVIAIGLAIINVIVIAVKNARIRESIDSGEFIHYEDFEDNWISAKRGRKGVAGYKYNDGPGCYVITIFDDEVTDDDYLNYDDIYIGQSVKVCQRVHNHFNGKGNGDVYADIKYGREVYVQIVPCDDEDMNQTEKDLIRAFNATKSYNKTKGGGARR